MRDFQKIIVVCCSLLLCSCKGNMPTSTKTTDTISNHAYKEKESTDTLRCAISHDIENADFEILIKQGDKTVHRFGGYKYPKDDALVPNGERTDSCLMADINFDGIKDVLVYLGCFGNSGIEYFDAFVWNAAKKHYIHTEEFKNIPNPTISNEYRCVLSAARNSAAENYYAKYAFEKGHFVKVAELKQYWKGNIYPERDRAVYEEHFLKTNIWKKNLRLNQISEFWKPVVPF